MCYTWEINTLRACRGDCMPVGCFVLVFSASSSKVRFVSGSVIRIRGQTILSWYVFCNNIVTVALCHRNSTRRMVPFLLILLIVQICLNLNIYPDFLYKQPPDLNAFYFSVHFKKNLQSTSQR